MESGILAFTSLHEYIRMHPEIPHKDEPTFNGFRELYLQLVKHIKDIPGWYAWIRVDKNNTSIVYIGQSQSRKTSSLLARITEEFLDEFVALWATIHDPETVVATLDRKYRGKYTAPIKRAARKAGATHLIWFGQRGLSDLQLNAVEYALIHSFNPPANRQSRSSSNEFPELVREAEGVLNHNLSLVRVAG